MFVKSKVILEMATTAFATAYLSLETVSCVVTASHCHLRRTVDVRHVDVKSHGRNQNIDYNHIPFPLPMYAVTVCASCCCCVYGDDDNDNAGSESESDENGESYNRFDFV